MPFRHIVSVISALCAKQNKTKQSKAEPSRAYRSIVAAGASLFMPSDFRSDATATQVRNPLPAILYFRYCLAF